MGFESVCIRKARLLDRQTNDLGVEAAEERVVREGGGVAYDYEFHTGACHRYVHAAKVAEETDLPGVVAAHKGDDYHVTLLTLKTVNGIN